MTQTSSKFLGLHERILRQSQQLLDWAAAPETEFALCVPRVSGWSVAQHVDHLAVVNLRIVESRILDTLKNPAQNPGGRPTLLGRLVLWTGFIPRGAAKAPEQTLPLGGSAADIRARVQAAHGALAGLRDSLQEIESCRAHSEHPRLGMFSPAEWLVFIEIHTHHHIKIVRDIKQNPPQK